MTTRIHLNGPAAVLIVTCILLMGIFATACERNQTRRPQREDLRPWQTEREQTAFMFALAEMIQPGPAASALGDCIDRIQRERDALKNGALMDARDQEDWSHTHGTLTTRAGDAPSGIMTVQAASRDVCEEPLRSCGNCHLPQKNNCDYFVYYKENGKVQRVYGRVAEVNDQFLEITGSVGLENIGPPEGSTLWTVAADEDGQGTFSGKIAAEDLIKAEWINGADPLITWWDFDRFNHRGEVAHKMLSIATEHNVSCTNCHQRHGDFTLTPAGEEFHRTGKVIRNEPLARMFGEIAKP